MPDLEFASACSEGNPSKLQKVTQDGLDPAHGFGPQGPDPSIGPEAADVSLADLIAFDTTRLPQAAFAGRNIHMNAKRRAGA